VSETGEILGLVRLFELLLDGGPRARVGSFIRQLLPVLPSEPASRLLQNLRSARTPVALVSENGKPVGLVFGEAVYRRLIAPANPS